MSHAIFLTSYLLRDVVALINRPGSFSYFGVIHTRTSEQLAGQYAYNSSLIRGYTSNEDIDLYLSILKDVGAHFNHDEALLYAISKKNNNK